MGFCDKSSRGRFDGVETRSEARRAEALVNLRPMGADDVRRVAAIEMVSNRSPWSESLFAGEFCLPESRRHWLVAVVVGVGDIVGFGGISIGVDEAEVLNLGVDVPWRRRGVGLQLCQALIAEAANRNLDSVLLEVRVSNQSAILLYEQLGMRSIGRRRGYYPDGEDAAVYWMPGLLDGVSSPALASTAKEARLQ